MKTSEELPDTIYNECPDCGQVTEHTILRAKLGNSNVTGTFKCNECGRVFTGTIRLPKKLEVKVLISNGDTTETAQTVLMEDEVVALGDEFDLDDGRHVCITHIDADDDKQRKKCNAPEVRTLWVKDYDVLHVKVSVNDYKKTYPMYVEADPDDEFVIGMTMHFDIWDCVIHAIKTKRSLIRRGSAEARDVVRIYAKIRHRGQGEGDVLDDGEEPSGEFDIDDSAMDLDDQ